MNDDRDPVKQFDTFQLLQAYERAIDENIISSITDTRGVILSVNPKFCETSKYSTDELVGQNHRIVNSGYHPKAFFATMWRTIAAGHVWHAEIRNQAKDGSYYWVDTVIVPIKNNDDQITHYLSLRTLITARKNQERRKDEQHRTLEESFSDLEKLDQAKDAFIATLSHELRTPLTSILGWSRVLQAGGNDEETVATAIESIEQSAKAQSRLIEDLLDVSRIILHKLEIEHQPLNLTDILQRAADMMRPVAQAKGLELILDLPAGPVVIDGDSARLQQVILNFLTNAIKFTPAGGRVTLDVKHFERHVEISVSDTGQGISAALLPHLFQRYQQGKGSVSKGGLGLGLAIAKHVVEAHGGTIEALSEGENHGATLVARLPLTDERAQLHVENVDRPGVTLAD
jgi:PAS domain S-box-containing protein